MSYIFKIKPQHSILVSSSGESNEPGYGVNSQLTAGEIAPREARIFDINTERMERLDVGTNNLGSSLTQHGYEVQIANDYDTDAFDTKNLYLCKTGLGSTRVADWAVGGILFTRMLYRINKSLSLIQEERNVTPTMWHIWSLGINDMFAGLSPSSFKTAFDIILDEMHTLYPSMKFILTKFNQPSYTNYNTTFDTIASERSSYTFTVYDASAQLEGDNTHWGTLGWKTLGAQITDRIQNN